MINFLTLNGFNTLFVKPKTFRSKFASESVNKETEQTMTGNISFEILRGLVGLSHRLRCIHARACACVCVCVCDCDGCDSVPYSACSTQQLCVY